MRSTVKKRAIVVVSFGTTYERAIDTCILPIEQAVAASFPSYDVYRAFTSQFVRQRLCARGIAVETMVQVLSRLSEEGYDEVIVQPTHMIDGAEYREKVLRAAESYQARFSVLKIGRPLLVCEEGTYCSLDHMEIARAVKENLPMVAEDEVILLMGHGSKCERGSVYPCLQAAFDAIGSNVLIGVMEEHDAMSLDSVMTRLAHRSSVRCIHLAPFLLVTGCHIRKDMAGDERSWQSRLERAGYRVRSYFQGLGENPAVRALYVKRIAEMIEE